MEVFCGNGVDKSISSSLRGDNNKFNVSQNKSFQALNVENDGSMDSPQWLTIARARANTDEHR
jgi:hypothetical protein